MSTPVTNAFSEQPLLGVPGLQRREMDPRKALMSSHYGDCSSLRRKPVLGRELFKRFSGSIELLREDHPGKSVSITLHKSGQPLVTETESR